MGGTGTKGQRSAAMAIAPTQFVTQASLYLPSVPRSERSASPPFPLSPNPTPTRGSREAGLECGSVREACEAAAVPAFASDVPGASEIPDAADSDAQAACDGWWHPMAGRQAVARRSAVVAASRTS